MELKTYSKSQKNLIRFFCYIGIAVEVLCIIRLFLRSDFNLGIPEITNLSQFLLSDLCLCIIDSASFLVFIILLFIPEKFELLTIVAFIYSFKIIAVETVADNPLGLLLYLLGDACLLYKGCFKKHTTFKVVSCIALYVLLVSLSLRFGVLYFINSFVITLGYGLAFLATIFFVVNFLKIVHVKRTARVWDLSQYPDLTERDKEWIKQIMDEKRYDEIARDSGITVGTLKNRMHQIFAIIGIEDRISMLATYGGYEIKG